MEAPVFNVPLARMPLEKTSGCSLTASKSSPIKANRSATAGRPRTVRTVLAGATAVPVPRRRHALGLHLFKNRHVAEVLYQDEPEPLATENRTVTAPAHDWHIGDLVYINHSDYLCNALVYNLYDRGDGTEGISLITEDGTDTGGWEPAMWHLIQFRHHTGLLYEFTNVTRLRRDFERGYFTPYFEIL